MTEATERPPVTAPAGVDPAALRHLADDARSARRLVTGIEDLVDELLRRHDELSRRVDDLNGGDGGEDSPTRMDLILDACPVGQVGRDLLNLADRICEQLGAEYGPPRAEWRWVTALERHIDTATICDALAASAAD